MNARVERRRYSDYVIVRGRIEADRFIPGWWVTPSREMLEAWPPPSEDSGWFAAAVDQEDRVLARAVATVTDADVCRTDDFQIDVGALLPLPPGTAAVVIAENDREVYRRAVPAQANIAFAEVLPERLERESTRVALRIQGHLPGEGAYVVLRWEAPSSAPWPLQIIAAEAADVLAEVDLRNLPGGRGSRLVAVYYDGIHTITLTSEEIELEPRPGYPVLILPLPGMQFGADGCVPLEAELDGDGDTGDLVWIVDGTETKRGPRGALEGLDVGRHVIVLRYQQEETSIEIEIVDPALSMPQTATPTPPWRVGPATWLGLPPSSYS